MADIAGDTGCAEDWPDALKQMRNLDNLLRCPICCELINTAMMVPKCSHTYCSLCIRRYSCFKSQCPTCNTAVSEPELLNNRLVDEVVTLFEEVRPALLEVVKGALKKGIKVPEIKTTKPTKAVVKDLPTSSESKDFDIKQKPTQSSSKDNGRPFALFSPRGNSSKRKYVSEISEFDDDFDDVMICDGPAAVKKLKTDDSESMLPEPSTPSLKKQWSINSSTLTPKAGSSSSPSVRSPSVMSPSVMSPGSVATPTGRKPLLDFHSPPLNSGTQSPFTESSTSSQTPGSSNKVPCPVCQAEVPERNINLHLDRCLSGSEKKEGLKSSLSLKRKLMPKLVYNLIKDGELRKKLNAVGLPTNGDRQAMINRHKEFTLIYNSECDSLKPRTAEEIVRDMSKSEQSKLKQVTINPVTSLQIKKGASTDEVEKAQKDYVKKHKSQFAQLVAEAKKRMKEKKKESNSVLEETQDTSTNESKPEDSCDGISAGQPIETEGDSSLPGGSSPNNDSSLPALPLEALPDISSTVSYEDESSHASSELFCNQAAENTTKEQTELSKTNTSDLLLQLDDDSNCSNCSESLLTEVPVKAIETKITDTDTDVTLKDTLKITPVDFNDPFSVSSPGISTDVLSQISDSNDIPLTQASKSSRMGQNKNAELFNDDKMLENASQRSGISFASSESSRVNDDLSDYTPDPDEMHDSDFGEPVRKRDRPKRKAQTKKKTEETPTSAKKSKKSKAKTSVPEDVSSSPSENIDINNIVNDPDFIEKPTRRLRARKAKA